jgi:hypothetical protein
MKGDIHFTETLNRDRRKTHADRRWEGFMKYATEMDSVAMIYRTKFH